MSPYIVPDHVLERSLSTTPALTPTFWTTLTIVSFDSLGSPQTKVMPKDDGPAWLSQSSDGSTNTNTPRSKVVDPPPVQHDRFFFDEGNVTFLVRFVRSDADGY
jgi:hypothetical protein